MLYGSCAPTVRSAHSFAGGCMLACSTLCRLVIGLAVIPTAAAAQADKIPWVKGPTKGVLGTEATIGVPAGCLFTGVDGVKIFLEVTENPVSGNERGVVMCQSDATPDPWCVLFSYDQSGHVRDGAGLILDDAASPASRGSGTAPPTR